MTTRFSLTVESDGADLTDDPDAAIADLLRRLANVIGCRGTFDGEGTARDANGNTVGRWTMTAEADADQETDDAAEWTAYNVAAQHGQADGYECPECGAIRPAMRHTAGCPNY